MISSDDLANWPFWLRHGHIECDTIGWEDSNSIESQTVHILRHHNFGLCLTHSMCQHKYSTERQQKLPFSDPTQVSFCWRNIGMVITKLCLSPLVLTFCTIVKLSIKETVYDPGWHKCTPYLLYLSTYCPISLLSFSKEDIAELDKMFLTISVDEL